jgi:hypothetical protein
MCSAGRDRRVRFIECLKFSSDDAMNFLPATPIIQNDLVGIFYKLHVDEHSACVEYINKKKGGKRGF